MAAIYSGIYLKLKSTKTPWEDRLKLAHFAWISHHCILPNKEQVLLDWVSHALVGYHTKKLELDEDIAEKLWVYLDNILCSRKLESFTKDGKTVSLRFAIAQVINEKISQACTLRPQRGISTVLSCCRGILCTPALSVIYTAKQELLVELLSKLFQLACHQLMREEPVIPQVFDVLHLTLNQYLQNQRQQSNPNRTFGHVAKYLLQPSLLLRYLLMTRSWVKEDDVVHHHLSKEIRNKMEAMLQAGIFQVELFPSYKEELLLLKDTQEKKKGHVRTLLSPVSTLLTKLGDHTFCEPALHCATVANSLPILYKLFLDSYCKEGNLLVCFCLLTRLFDSEHLSFLGEDKEMPSTPTEWSLTLLAMEQLLTSVIDHDIYNVAVDRIRHEETQFQFYRRLAETLINNPQSSIPAWFRCLKALIVLNHLIVEPDLDDLVASAWIDADITDLRVQKAQEILLSTLFQTYARLRQFPKLFEEVLSVICRPAAEELRQPVLTASLTTKLCECLLELPPNQILDIWTLVLEKCQTLILPDIRGDSDMALKLLSMSSVLHTILFNMKSLNNTTPVPVVHRTQCLMVSMWTKLVKPLLHLLRDHYLVDNPPLWLEKVSNSALLLTYTWAEMNTLLILNCSKYVSPVHTSATSVFTASSAENWDFSFLLPEVNFWDKIVRLSNQFHSASKYYLELLMLQKMKKILMEVDFQYETNFKTLQHATAFILHSGTEKMNVEDPEPWNGNASTLNFLSYPVAHWHLIVSNVPILMPYMSANDLNSMADFILKTLPTVQNKEYSADPSMLITLEKVSESLLHSAVLPEIQALQCAFISSIIQQFNSMLCTSLPNVSKQVFCQLSADNIPWHEPFPSFKRDNTVQISSDSKQSKDELSICWTVLANVAQSILLQARAGPLGCLLEHQIDSLLSLLDILSKLTPDSFMPSDSTRCFLLLLSLTTITRPDGSCSTLKTLLFLRKCYHLLICLQNGRYFNSVFKVLHASDILEIVMNTLFEASQEWASCRGILSWLEFLQTIETFLESFLHVIIERRNSVRLNLVQFTSFLTKCNPCLEATSSRHWKNWNPQVEELLLMAQSVLCRVTMSHLQEQQDKKTPNMETLTAVLKPTVLSMGSTIQYSLRSKTLKQMVPSFSVACVTVLLESELSQRILSITTKDSSLKKSDALDGLQELQHIQLYRSFCSQIMKELCCAQENFQFLKSALRFLAVFCSVPDKNLREENFVITVFSTLKKLLAGPWITISVIENFEVELKELVAQLVEKCSLEEFYILMKLVLQGLEVSNIWKQNPKEVLSAITLMKPLLSCPVSGDSEKAFWFTAPQIITALVMLTQEASQDTLLIPIIIVPILEVVAALLRQGEGIIRNPHHVTLAFSILLIVPLDHLKMKDYYNIFLGIHEVLFSILQFHLQVMLKAVPSFLNCFHRLVASVMHEGRQKGDKGTTPELEVVLKCAHLVERMYTHIAAKTEEFTVFSPLIVAEYVNKLQKVTLHPAVKKHLTEGIYRILDLCIANDIKFLNASLQMGVREVFKELHNDYLHYHKMKNQGDEKYTA
uniref:Unhealthy ribosome biogenesis protein 2 homolog n=1 Tax=Geotrypetes seraphini TaxID=260995 RepID=A0A6P8QC80_GEOSA|nr:unhealthy ribosome biogenesis protein 2 homolog [Geotrypetes seraphini]XP_033793949.1 unhealthy ribosome biogenesis protein 2 homolog [Geotrypetes seraphini]XP_033793951.1 unhealthy ribosome biogenesis protein 2 homolog [Geotrypetes seraphini]XP_033793952.1 unhealthy ribosome biogenesis protein 2 homolog [Geotrypetes seraphini]